MTNIETMKLALDALEDIFGKGKVDVGAINALRQAISEAEQAEQEPVAYAGMIDGSISAVYTQWPVSHYHKIKPLYTAPPKAEQEPVGDGISLQSITHPHTCCVICDDISDEAIEVVALPQREWVSLTDDEINKISHAIANAMPAGMTIEDWKRSFARSIEAKLKEKNT